MRIASARLQNFRCFSSIELEFDRPIILLHGPNGSGKTSILEALHYACYFRSFKTHLPREIIQAQASGFGIGLSLASESYDILQVQYSNKQKQVKLNDRAVGSYKELYDAYKVVTVTEDDLQIVQGSPSARRTFLDTMVLLNKPSHALLLKKYRGVLDNRNALISRGRADQESYELWTNQLLEASRAIQQARMVAVAELEKSAQKLIKDIIPTVNDDQPPLTLTYSYSRPYSSLDQIESAHLLAQRYPQLKSNEFRQKRSLIGAHLDDISIAFLGKSCRSYSSRGQQKLVVFLMKLAQLESMRTQQSGTILLVDDFMTDFDEQRAAALLPLMTKLSSQVILTSPVESFVRNKLPDSQTQTIDISRLK